MATEQDSSPSGPETHESLCLAEEAAKARAAEANEALAKLIKERPFRTWVVARTPDWMP